MKPKSKVLIVSAATAACAGVLVLGAGAATPPAQTTQYPWVQLPAWVGTTSVPAPLPTAAYTWVQPPAWVPAG